MNINKKLTREGERETASEIDLFKSKDSGDLMYNSHYGIAVPLADKGYVDNTVSTAIADAIAEPMSSITFSVDPKTIGPKVVFTKSDYGNEVDKIIPGQVEITRGDNQGIYNYVSQEGYDNGGPLSTYWNSNFVDSTHYGWAKLGNALDVRNFDTWSASLDNNVGVNIVGKELVMVAVGDGITLFFMVKFTQWTEGSNGGGFSYERYQIFPQTIYEHRTNSVEGDKISEGLIIQATDPEQGIYNTVLETEFDTNHYLSPKGTRWSSAYTDSNLGGTTDYSNVRERIYDTWYNAVNRTIKDNLYMELIMHDLSTDLYWLIVFNTWTDDGDGGISFSYMRSLIPLDEGIKFSNGVYMTEMPSSGGATIDGDGNVIIGDSSKNTVSIPEGISPSDWKQNIGDFSGMLLVNDHYDGGIEMWICGGGTCNLVSATEASQGGGTMQMGNNGYAWNNVQGLLGSFTFTVIKTRLGS
jgi:hypothetical protein